MNKEFHHILPRKILFLPCVVPGRNRPWFPGILVIWLWLALACFGAEGLKPRQSRAKPARTALVQGKHDPSRIYVKFRDDLPVRLRNGRPDDGGQGALRPVSSLLNRMGWSGAVWRRQHRVDERTLNALRERAQNRTGKVMPDLNTAYMLHLPTGMDAAKTIDELNSRPEIEIALPVPLPSPPPVVPDYEPDQVYLTEATEGIDAEYAWTVPGGDGTGVRIVDIEYTWNLNHNDLNATLIGPDPIPVIVDGQAEGADHGTAVLGEMGGKLDGHGVTGIAHGATFFVTAQKTEDGWDPAAAIITATAALEAGDIMVLEMQMDGPGDADDDYVPIEWWEPAYNAIVTAVGNGIIVVEAAGNGAQDLDAAMFNDGHKPFLAENDSGAIIVGAGAPPGHTNGVRSRLDFSCYGSTVDMQGWGAGVVTTGYGWLYSDDGTNDFYIGSFNGTSSATPIVAGACAAIQGAHKARNGGEVLTPSELKALLQSTGSPQLSGLNPNSENIGPLPNLAAAIPLALLPDRIWVSFPYTGPEKGTFEQPFDTLPEGLEAVPDHGNLMIKAGTTTWTGSVDRPKAFAMRAVGGNVLIGQ